jgi:hypothetical protein
MTYFTQQMKELDWSPELGITPEDIDDSSSLLLFALASAEVALGERDPITFRLVAPLPSQRFPNSLHTQPEPPENSVFGPSLPESPERHGSSIPQSISDEPSHCAGESQSFPQNRE